MDDLNLPKIRDDLKLRILGRLLGFRMFNDAEREFQYDECDRKFSTNAQLKQHKKRIHSSQPIQCLKCNISFETIPQLTYHNKKHHKQNHPAPKKDEATNFKKCPISSKNTSTTTTRHTLATHVVRFSRRGESFSSTIGTNIRRK